MISSLTNPKVKYASSVIKGKSGSKNEVVIEGLHLLEESLNAHKARRCVLKQVFYSKKLMDLKGGGQLLRKINDSAVPAEEVTDKVIGHLTDVGTPQGIIGLVAINASDLGELFEQSEPVILILDGIQDPGNIGTIIRTADAFGISGIIMTKNTVNPYSPKVIRSTAGSIFNVRITSSDFPENIYAALKRRGIKIVATTPDAGSSIIESDLSPPLAVIIGSESRGISDESAKASDEKISIPMVGKSESLNAAVSASVVLYEVMRQRMKHGK